MRIIKISTLTKFGKAFPQAKEWLKANQPKYPFLPPA